MPFIDNVIIQYAINKMQTNWYLAFYDDNIGSTANKIMLVIYIRRATSKRRPPNIYSNDYMYIKCYPKDSINIS